MRIDKYLKVSRILKRREVAKQLALNERLFINGNNIFSLDKIKIIDPEFGHLGNAAYPTQRAMTIGVQLGF